MRREGVDVSGGEGRGWCEWFRRERVDVSCEEGRG